MHLLPELSHVYFADNNSKNLLVTILEELWELKFKTNKQINGKPTSVYCIDKMQPSAMTSCKADGQIRIL